MLSDIIVLYNEGKVRNIYAHEADALCDKERLESKGYKNIRLQRRTVEYTVREGEPIDIETLEALKRCVERS